MMPDSGSNRSSRAVLPSVVATGTAATFTGIFSAEISSLLDEIAEQQRALGEKKRQVAALTGLRDTMGRLKQNNEAAKLALTHISTMWNDVASKLDDTLTSMKNAVSGDEFKKAAAKLNVAAAQKNWKDTADFARKVQALAAGTSVQPPLQHEKLLAMAR